MIRKDREKRKGGGVAILIKSYIKYNTQPSNLTIQNNYEILWTQVNFHDSLYYVGALYHPPSPTYNINEMLNYLDDCVQEINSIDPQARIILAGDFNALSEQSITDNTGLINIVNKPTRGPNILDEIFVTGINYPEIKIINSLVNSDHKAILATDDKHLKNYNKIKESHQIRDRSSKNTANLREFLTQNAPPQFQPNNSTQESFDTFYDYSAQLLNTFYPIHTITTSSSDPPFVTPYIKFLLRKKNKLMRQGKLNEADNISIKIQRLICNKKSTLLRVDSPRQPTEMWSQINKILKPKIKQENLQENDQINARNLNSHYANVSTDNNYKCPQLKKTVANNSEVYFQEMDVHKALTQLKRTATGYDNLPYWFLKITADFLYKTITQLFNMSVNQCAVPKQWKKAEIHPIPKVSQPKELAEYRPISITPVLSRMAEKIITRNHFSKIYSGIHKNDFDDQYAFRPGGSTTAAIIAILHTISIMLENNTYVRLIALDFSKAFDTIRHHILFNKLSKYEIPDAIYNWTVDYFDGHCHRTKFNDINSDFANTNAGVIQGSALGPHCFTVTAVDLKPVSESNIICKYADDTYLIIPESNVDSTQTEIKNIEEWSKLNNLKLNIKKSIEVIIRKPRTNINSPSSIEDVQRTNTISILGIQFNSVLSTSDHVNNVLNRAFAKLQTLKLLRSYGLDGGEMDRVFHLLVQSQVIYAAQAWHGFMNAQDLTRLQSFFKKSHKWRYCTCDQYVDVKKLFKTHDERLLNKILTNNKHTLFRFIPTINNHYNLRHTNFNLPTLTTIKEKNFVYRTLFNYPT